MSKSIISKTQKEPLKHYIYFSDPMLPSTPRISLECLTRLCMNLSIDREPYLSSKRVESESCSFVSSVLQPHGLYNPRSSPGQNTGVE